jgi:addiction module HigA family antidote
MSIRIEELESLDFSDVVEPGATAIPPTRPGELLRHEFMEPLGLSANALAGALQVPTNRVTGILNGTRSITADTALRLSRAFGTSAEFWLNAQSHFDMLQARAKLGASLSRVQRLVAA